LLSLVFVIILEVFFLPVSQFLCTFLNGVTDDLLTKLVKKEITLVTISLRSIPLQLNKKEKKKAPAK
jgi:hypothetical protein